MVYFIFILIIGILNYKIKKKDEDKTENKKTILTTIRNKKQ